MVPNSIHSHAAAAAAAVAGDTTVGHMPFVRLLSFVWTTTILSSNRSLLIVLATMDGDKFDYGSACCVLENLWFH